MRKEETNKLMTGLPAIEDNICIKMSTYNKLVEQVEFFRRAFYLKENYRDDVTLCMRGIAAHQIAAELMQELPDDTQEKYQSTGKLVFDGYEIASVFEKKPVVTQESSAAATE